MLQGGLRFLRGFEGAGVCEALRLKGFWDLGLEVVGLGFAGTGFCFRLKALEFRVLGCSWAL